MMVFDVVLFLFVFFMKSLIAEHFTVEVFFVLLLFFPLTRGRWRSISTYMSRMVQYTFPS